MKKGSVLKMKKFRFAILGPGRIARKFASAVALIPDCEICAVASKSGERARAFASEFGIASAYGDYAEMLEKSIRTAPTSPRPTTAIMNCVSCVFGTG